MKIMVIGCTHAGTSAVVNARRLFPDATITVYERNDNISFLSCGIALYLGGVVKDVNGLFYSSPSKLKEKDIETKMKHEVVSVDIYDKKAKIKDLTTGKVFEDTFDKLIITSGSWPVVPEIEGIDLENVLLCKNFAHATKIFEVAKQAKKIVVVGGGYIGVELIEAFNENGKEVTLIDLEPRIMSKYLDKEFTELAEKSLKREGIKFSLNEKVVKFEGLNGKVNKVVTDKASYDADMVVFCIGFRPNTDIFKGQLDMMKNGAIKVDEYMHTSKEDVLAAGDCATVFCNPIEDMSYIPLATNAVRGGTLAAINLVEKKVKGLGTQGTSGIKIYENSIASTGITEEEALKKGIKAKSVTVIDAYRPEFMPTHEKVMFKVVYNEETRVIIGAQLLSEIDLTQVINAMSVCIQNKVKVEDLAFMDFFFQPHFNKPWSFINLVGLEVLKENS